MGNTSLDYVLAYKYLTFYSRKKRRIFKYWGWSEIKKINLERQ